MSAINLNSHMHRWWVNARETRNIWLKPSVGKVGLLWSVCPYALHTTSCSCDGGANYGLILHYAGFMRSEDANAYVLHICIFMNPSYPILDELLKRNLHVFRDRIEDGPEHDWDNGFGDGDSIGALYTPVIHAQILYGTHDRLQPNRRSNLPSPILYLGIRRIEWKETDVDLVVWF